MTHTKTILDALPAIPGATHHAIAKATGLKPKAVQRALELLKPSRRVVCEKMGRINYYFIDQASKDAAMPELERRAAAIRAAAKIDKATKSAARYKAHRSKRTPKPIKLIQPKPVNREAAARLKFSAQEAIKPASVKVQQCPGFTGRHRYEADPKCHGAGLMDEWRKLRGRAHPPQEVTHERP